MLGMSPVELFGVIFVSTLVVLAIMGLRRKPKLVPVPVKKKPEPRYFKPNLEELDQKRG